MSDPNLITTYTFQGHPFLVKMNIINGCLELILTDKHSGEEWECSYDASYIESLTRKTGNFKQFEIFATMLKSGLLKTSESIALDLLTYEDLESMKMRRTRNYSSTRLLGNNTNNRRYLIITYSVEFDKINYPLPLEYCGPPDPVILQATIRKLEAELSTANEELSLRDNSTEKQKIRFLQKRVDDLTAENIRLNEEVKHLSRIISRSPNGQVDTFQKAITQIEKNLMSERNSHHRLLEKLQKEKMYLATQVEKLKNSENSLKAKLQQVLSHGSLKTNHVWASKSYEPTINTIYQRRKSPNVRKPTRNIQVHTQQSRSASPTIIRNVHTSFNNCSENIRPPKSKSKSRSRSSSISSTQHPHREVYQHTHYSTETTPTASPRYSRKQSSYSDKSSTKSYSSEVRRNRLKKQTSHSRSISPNVSQLENKVNKMFQNRRINKRILK